MILICYDGSSDARAAIAQAGRLLRGKRATVVTVWEPVSLQLLHSPAGHATMAGLVYAGDTDATNEKRAAKQAAEGAQLARAAGFDATARTQAQKTTVAEAIISHAEKAGADAVVIGSRGLTGLKSLLLGSVSRGVLQHAHGPVIVVPSPGVAAARAARRGVTAASLSVDEGEEVDV